MVEIHFDVVERICVIFSELEFQHDWSSRSTANGYVLLISFQKSELQQIDENNIEINVLEILINHVSQSRIRTSDLNPVIESCLIPESCHREVLTISSIIAIRHFQIEFNDSIADRVVLLGEIVDNDSQLSRNNYALRILQS